MSKREREEACYICGHYHDYDNGEPCSICGHVLTHVEKKANEGVLPTAIVPGFLYLGSYDTASRSELLRAMAITHILNTVPNCQALFKNTFAYHTASSSPPDFDECFEFIEKVNAQENNKLLVYCMSGISRSPTIVIGYLMKTRGWRLAESYKWVKDKRPAINIKDEDAQRLINLEMKLHGSCSVPQGFAALAAGSSSLFNPGLPSTSMSPPQPSTSAPSFGAAGGQQTWSMACPAAAGGGVCSAPHATGFAFGSGPGGQGPGAAQFVFGSSPPAGSQTAGSGGQQQQRAGQGAGADAEMEM